MLVSSFPNSGSSLLSQILRSQNNSILYFEPMKPVYFHRCLTVPECTTFAFRDILKCLYSFTYKKYILNNYYQYFHGNFNCKSRHVCNFDYDMDEICRNSTIRMINAVKVPLGYLSSMLRNRHFHMKIVHLLRDPRSVLTPTSSLNMQCQRAKADVQSYQYMKEAHGDPVIQMHFERFCQTPMDHIQYLFKFLFDIDPLPKETIDLVHQLTTTNEKNTIENQIDCQTEYKKWRENITIENLDLIQDNDDCSFVINNMDLRFFNGHDVRNLNLSIYRSY